MGGRRISHTLKGTVLASCFTRAYMSRLETMTLIEKHQETVKIYKNTANLRELIKEE